MSRASSVSQGLSSPNRSELSRNPKYLSPSKLLESVSRQKSLEASPRRLIKVPSVTSSPVRHCIRKVGAESPDRAASPLKEKKRDLGLFLDKKDREAEEHKFEVFNANGKFSCSCGVCMIQSRPAGSPPPKKKR